MRSIRQKQGPSEQNRKRLRQQIFFNAFRLYRRSECWSRNSTNEQFKLVIRARACLSKVRENFQDGLSVKWYSNLTGGVG